MKKFLSILLSIAVLLCCAVPFCADTVYRCGDWTLGVVSGAEDYSFSIRSYDGEDAVVTAPADYGGYPIIRIDGYAFATNTKVQEVILSDTITSIGAGAFSQCGNLTRIVIPDAVTQIADDAFQNCDQVVIYAPADSDAITYAIEALAANAVGQRGSGTRTAGRAAARLPPWLDTRAIRLDRLPERSGAQSLRRRPGGHPVFQN